MGIALSKLARLCPGRLFAALALAAPALLATLFTLAADRAGAENPRPVTLFAAASLGDALAAATAGRPVTLSLGGSGAIARQIDHGAPADAVMLASEDWMDWLESRGHLRPGTRQSPIANSLVLVGPPAAAPLATLSPESLAGRLGETGRLAMGEHRSVPAGQYAKAWLQSRGLWEFLQSRLAETENVRAALALVSRGEVPLALVYSSDLVAAPGAATPVWTIPATEQPPITYGLAALTEAGAALVSDLTAPEAMAVFARFGFEVRP